MSNQKIKNFGIISENCLSFRNKKTNSNNQNKKKYQTNLKMYPFQMVTKFLDGTIKIEFFNQDLEQIL